MKCFCNTPPHACITYEMPCMAFAHLTFTLWKKHFITCIKITCIKITPVHCKNRFLKVVASSFRKCYICLYMYIADSYVSHTNCSKCTCTTALRLPFTKEIMGQLVKTLLVMGRCTVCTTCTIDIRVISMHVHTCTMQMMFQFLKPHAVTTLLHTNHMQNNLITCACQNLCYIHV